MNIDFSLFDEEIEREIARRSLHEFIQYINPEYITSHFSQTVCDALDQFLVDMMDGNSKPQTTIIVPSGARYKFNYSSGVANSGVSIWSELR